MIHRATYGFTGSSHLAVCSCGWRSPLRADKADVEDAHEKHKEQSA